MEQFKDNEDVGLIVKASIQNTSNIDRVMSTERMQKLANSDRLKRQKV